MTAQSDGEPPDGKFSHLRTSKSSQRLNQVEKIRAHGVGDLISLPALVVCGDQSTECDSVTITASIRPHISRPAEVQQTLSAYRKQLKDMSELPGVIEEVSRLMNIRGCCDNENASAFSVDVLRIEVTGPIGLHLSVVDLPGLISVANEEQTEEDVEAVHSMVASYLQSSRTIILAVLQANNDMANQPIIKLARTHDPLGQRTVGIITKPDLINHGSEAKIALVAKNKDNIKLKLGFFLLKNPSPAELKECVTMAARSNLERRFFSSPAWANQNLDMSREFLTALSMRFYELSQAALDGNYHSIDTRFFSESDISRLRARVQKSNTKFAIYMRESGKRRKLKIEVNRDNTVPESDDSEDDKLDDITTQLIVNKAGMMRWVKEAYARTKGKELPGNYNSALLAELFHEQSRRWPTIAESHIDTILKIVSEWIQLAVERLIPEESMRAQVHSILQQWLEETEKNALGELEKLVEDERRSPLTYNHYYTDNVQKARLDAQKKAVENAVSAERDNHGKLHVSNVQVDIQKFIAAIGSRITVDMDEQACHEAITELDAYYKVTMKTFVDNVARQVIERHVIAPLPNAFSPNSVSQLSEEDLLRIGSESEKQIARREKLALQVQGLKKSLRDLQKSSL
ncbi:interferon-induced GTP-binding protein Mx2 [Trichoderma harzianum]|uniref:Interferon-induced GTP-binding protein Mx2 n=1 Tax=Trichoderma harzianum TaxID=5544 RepID=A0A0F9ZHD7_TRIHA|nr:interferon-induced GTP-binding protein Mx2 [Trichoderma harzianum]